MAAAHVADVLVGGGGDLGEFGVGGAAGGEPGGGGFDSAADVEEVQQFCDFGGGDGLEHGGTVFVVAAEALQLGEAGATGAAVIRRPRLAPVVWVRPRWSSVAEVAAGGRRRW
ncbi:MAG: hypothetical protein U0232_19360 [Thermomicrobiales bacterium]